jgi:hypothetical protein
VTCLESLAGKREQGGRRPNGTMECGCWIVDAMLDSWHKGMDAFDDCGNAGGFLKRV